MGGCFKSVNLRAYARKTIVQLQLGIFDYLDRILARPPYSLVHTCVADATPCVVRACVDDFFQERRECLPFLARLWRGLYPGRAALVEHGAHEIRLFLERACISIDPSERSHGAMRQDLRSSGRARSHTVSANRILTREALDAHRARGGSGRIDYATIMDAGSEAIKDASALESEEGLPALPAAASALVRVCDKKASRQLGSAYLQHSNVVEASHKALRGRNRKLTPDDQRQISERAKATWDEMGPELRASFQRLARAPKPPKETPSAQLNEDPSFKGLWGLSKNRKLPIPAGLLADVGGSRPLPDALTWRNRALKIAVADVPARTKDCEGLLSWTDIHGCHVQKENICCQACHSAIDWDLAIGV